MRESQILKMSIKSCLAYHRQTTLIIVATAIGVIATGLGQAIFASSRNKILEKVNCVAKNCVFLFANPNKANSKPLSMTEFQRLEKVLTKQFGSNVKAVPILVYKYTAQSKEKPFGKFGTMVSCVGPEAFEVIKRKVCSGRGFSQADRFKKVCVVGPKAAKNFGKTVSFDGLSFTVIGTLETAPQIGQQDPNEEVFIPFDIANVLLNDSKIIHEVAVMVAKEALFCPVVDTINRTLKEMRKTKLDSDKDWTIFDHNSFRQTSLATTKLLQNLILFFSLIAIILSFLACINSILANIKSREREIQVMLKIGARKSTVLRMFLYESAFKFAIGLSIGLLACKLSAMVLGINLFCKTYALELILGYLSLSSLACIVLAWQATNKSL